MAAAERAGDYRRSTVEKSLDEEGFIHCSFAAQVQATADRYYRGRRDVVLLTIDPSLLQVEVRVENLFPHIYGPLPIDAVIRVQAVPVDSDGRLDDRGAGRRGVMYGGSGVRDLAAPDFGGASSGRARGEQCGRRVSSDLHVTCGGRVPVVRAGPASHPIPPRCCRRSAPRSDELQRVAERYL